MIRLFIVFLVVAFTIPAHAEQPSFSYVTAGYQRVELDDDFGFDVSANALNLGGSYELSDNWHVLVDYSSADFDFDIDLTTLAVGVGYHTAVSATTSVYADLAWVSAEIDAGFFGSEDDDGYGVEVGVRSFVSDRVELQGAVSYLDLGSSSDSTSFEAAGWYHFNSSFALGLTASAEEDAVGYGIGGRMFFGK